MLLGAAPLRHPSLSMPDSTIELAQFLKLQHVVGSGGEAKLLVQSGQVMVNGEVETRRGRKLQPGDVVSMGDRTWRVGDSGGGEKC
jgi:ribosome-associated protein